MPVPRHPPFLGRSRERQTLDGLLDRVRGGAGAALVLRGEAGIGKTALMRYCARQASGCRVVQFAGVESEMQLPFAALHQMCGPMLGAMSALPEPQEQALQVAFGLAAGAPPDRFVLGLAVLSLLAEAATERPLVCLIDDAQWLDDASALVLGFVGRRLLADSVLLLFAVREVAGDQLFAHLASLPVEGLTEQDAGALLTAAIPGHLDDRVRDRIVAETRGNPLELLELAGGMNDAELAGGFAGSPRGMLTGRLHDHYLRRIRALPMPTQRLMLLSAADPTGDATLVWRAAHALGVTRDAAAPAEADQLLQISSSVRFRHPLVRSAAYAAGAPEDRRATHAALAEATEAGTDPERRVWHLAAAAAGPDDDIAAELETAATRAGARAGLAASAAFLQRSVALTAEPGPRAGRALAAASASLSAGAFDTALGLLAQADADAVDDLQRARVEQLRAQINWASVAGREAPVLLIHAAKRLESLDLDLARETYLDAWVAAAVAGPLTEPSGQLPEVSAAAWPAARQAPDPRPCDLLLDGLATLITEGRAGGRTHPAACGRRLPRRPGVHRGLAALGHARPDGGDGSVGLHRLGGAEQPVRRPRPRVGGPRSAVHRAERPRHGGHLVRRPRDDDGAGRGEGRGQRGHRDSPGGHLRSAPRRVPRPPGRGASRCSRRPPRNRRSVARDSPSRWRDWAAATLYNGLGRYAEALAAAQPACAEIFQPMSTQLLLPELIEAAVRSANRRLAEEGLQRLSVMVAVDTGDWGKGLEARARALLSEGATAERCYAEAVERLGRTPLRPDLARAHLLYGEWLRRENRRVDARHQLRIAYELFTAIGADAFAGRASRELLATGGKVRRRAVDTQTELTSQEEHIARLARDGRTNPEIGALLFISARTVEWHLRKVFGKLGITSRKGLEDALPRRSQAANL